MDQPIIAPLNPEPPKKSFPAWSFIAVFSFFLGVASVLAYQRFQPTRIIPVGPSPSPVIADLSPSSDLTADWETYTNTKYGFLIKYDPNNQPIEIAGTGQQLALISFGTMKNNGFDIEISTGDTLEYYKNRIMDHVTGIIDKEEKITVAGIVGTKLTYKQVIVIDNFDVSQVIINKNDRDYIITAFASDIDQILSTFKFVDQTCQYNGKTYQNGEEIPDKCNFCSCESGQVACTLRACDY